MMTPDLMQIGVGGMFALMVLDRVFTFLKTRSNGRMERSAGERSVEFWQQQQTAIITTVMRDSVTPILAAQQALMAKIVETQAEGLQILKHLERQNQ